MDGKEFVGCIFKGNSNAFLCKFAITEVGGGAFCPLQKTRNQTRSFAEFASFPLDCEHVRLLWSKHRQLLDVRRKGEVGRLVDVEVLEEEGGHLLDAGHGQVATYAVVRSG